MQSAQIAAKKFGMVNTLFCICWSTEGSKIAKKSPIMLEQLQVFQQLTNCYVCSLNTNIFSISSIGGLLTLFIRSILVLYIVLLVNYVYVIVCCALAGVPLQSSQHQAWASCFVEACQHCLIAPPHRPPPSPFSIVSVSFRRGIKCLQWVIDA
jgi:hypothetical protein